MGAACKGEANVGANTRLGFATATVKAENVRWNLVFLF